jgi:hypothetical protein
VFAEVYADQRATLCRGELKIRFIRNLRCNCIFVILACAGIMMETEVIRKFLMPRQGLPA